MKYFTSETWMVKKGKWIYRAFKVGQFYEFYLGYENYGALMLIVGCNEKDFNLSDAFDLVTSDYADFARKEYKERYFD